MFESVEGSANFSAQEESILGFWRENDIYEKSLELRSGAKEFVFYEGPPTANGMPHPGHCLTRTIKDVFPRYQTMRGKRCTRKAGWDTHGLPVEVEVCKELGIHSKEEIEAYGIEPFIQKCQQSVWRYMQQWEKLTERLGFWVNLEEAYVTYHQSYVESVWWSLKQLFDRDLLYRGHKIVWWWAQGGTALSSGEVGQGYRQVADPSVFVRFPLLDDSGKATPTSLLVWTTTPWTLPSNQFAAVHAELDYCEVEDESGTRLIVAQALVETIAQKRKTTFNILKQFSGTELVGRRYLPPFDYYYSSQGQTKAQTRDGANEPTAWRVVAADFVTTDSGTGVVHLAPAFGEEDFNVLSREQQRFPAGAGPQLICAVGPDGKFTSDAPDYEGRWVKDCDKEITRGLKDRELLYHQEQYLHDYPFCWRAEDDPLIQYPRESWFVRTRSYRDQLVANNRGVNWLPDHIRDGRMGKFLESNVDWALSRERYWGTPLPIWECESTGRREAIAGYDELLAKPGIAGTEVWENAKAANPELPDDLCVHKPYIDAVTYASPFAEGARMRRVPEVIDCWYDSGAMPFAQWGYRGQEAGAAAEAFERLFPADFISEALDQTRGWFYSQLAISTLLFGPSPDSNASNTNDKVATKTYDFPHPFKTCIVLGLLLGEDGQKMSKSKRNYREPQEIFDKYGADALRWFFLANQPPWTSIRYSEQAIKDTIPEFLLRLWNVFSFFSIYANIDEFEPEQELEGDVGAFSTDVLAQAKSYRPLADRGELDRWIMAELDSTTQQVVACMDQFDSYGACQHINRFVDGLSNWYVRRSRDRFWMSDRQAPEKLDAYWTLYECLLTTSKLVAPFVPFLAETLWQKLVRGPFQDRAAESVHLTDYPAGKYGQSIHVDIKDNLQLTDSLNADLREQMALIREISSLGRAARSNAQLKVRQPLAKVEVVLADDEHLQWLQAHTGLIEEELNVKAVEFTTEGQDYITYAIVPNFKRLGPKLGKNMPIVKKLLGERDGGELLAEMNDQGHITLTLPSQDDVQLTGDEIEIRLGAKPGWAAAQGKECVVVLATELTDELIREGYANDLVRLIQEYRKELGLEFTDRITIQIATKSDELQQAITEHQEFIARETLAVSLDLNDETLDQGKREKVGGFELRLLVERVDAK